jgi:hypothetical protein
MMRLRKTVRLNGVNYEIDSEKITRLVARLEPKAIDKYWVRIQGRRFSPKQVVSELLKVPLVDFTTMDATRILAAVGFEVRSADEKPEPVSTPSDSLLKEYLRSHGLTDVEVEPVVENSSSRPDYRLRVDGAEVLFDVEDFTSKLEDSRIRGGAPNPYGPIREKLNTARRRFKDMEGHCCCLILENSDKSRIDLTWQIVMGAMLGDLTFPSLAPKARPADPSRTQEDTLGKQATVKNQSPENAIISAAIVVERYGIGEERFRLFVHDWEQKLGRDLGVEEYRQVVEQSAGTDRDLSLNRVRVRVHENPHANVPLDRRLFRGPFDERYGVMEDPNQWGQVYIGAGVSEFEKLSDAAKLLSRS